MAAMMFCGGCIANLDTPTRYEKIIPAEYDIGKHKEQKILVLVEQSGWLEAGVNLRYYLTEAINEGLSDNVKTEPNQLIAYDAVAKFRSSNPDFSLMSPVQLGQALGADLVLYIPISRYELSKEADSDYYTGVLDAQAVLMSVPDERKLWPESEESKSISVGFDIENRGPEIANQRLVKSLAHCIVRYLYDCPKDKFQIADDRSNVDWEKW
jgi:hypothetical protein